MTCVQCLLDAYGLCIADPACVGNSRPFRADPCLFPELTRGGLTMWSSFPSLPNYAKLTFVAFSWASEETSHSADD